MTLNLFISVQFFFSVRFFSGNFIGDASPALLIVMLFYIIPSNPDDSSSPALLDWKTTQDKIPWNIVLLIGGGFALAEGSKVW